MESRTTTECHRVPAASVLGLAAAWLFASCGAGTAAIVGGSSSDSGSSNAPTTVGAVAVSAARASPVTVSFTLFDPESDPARVRLRYLTPGSAADQGIELALLGDTALDRVATSPGGELTTVSWDFASQLGGTAFTRDLTVVVTVNGADDLVSLGNAVVIDVGNDAPEILGVGVPGPGEEVAGLIAVPIELRDQGDALDLALQYERPAGVWHPARPAGLAPGTPTPEIGMEGVPSDEDGLSVTFVWDSAADLPGADATVRLRVSAHDGLATTEPVETAAFHVDNNARPSVRLLDASLVASEDRREGLSLPFVVTDTESDPVDVVVQWQVAGSPFPALELEPEALRAALADPVRRRELQIVSERPLVHDGRVGRLPPGLDPLRNVRLPELGRNEIHALPRGIAGRVLELPRGLVPRPLGAEWSESVLRRPVCALPTDDELAAVVLDEPTPGSWRLLAVELESETLRRLLAEGAGRPRALAADAADGWLVGIEQGADFEVRWIASDGTTRAALLGSDSGLAGPLRGLASRASGVFLATAGDALLEGRLGATPGLVRLLDGLAEPSGIVIDPDRPGCAFVAEHGGVQGGVRVIDLITRVVRPLGTDAPGLPRPTALALDHAHRHLYVLTDEDPGDGRVELRGVHLDGPRAREPFTFTDELPSGATSLAMGRDLRLVALPESDELAAGGGVRWRRTLAAGSDAYDSTRQVVTLETPLPAPAPPGAPWRLLGTLGAARSTPEGRINHLLWDLPADFDTDADVVIRAIPLDQDLGTLDESIVAKRASVFGFDAESEPRELTSPFVVTANDQTGLALADLDGDGLEDLVTSSSRTSAIALFHQAQGTFAEAPDRILLLPTGSFPQDIACGDLDQDGREDVLVACGGTRSVAVFLQGPLGLPDEASLFLALDGNPRRLALADVDLDGQTDVLVASTGTNDIRMFVRGAGGSFVLAPDRLRFFTAEPGGVVAGDVDGDGDVDIVGGRADTGAAWLFERRPDGTYPAVKTHVFDAVDKVNEQLLLEDVNGDGTSDLVCVSNGGLDLLGGGGLGAVSIFYLGTGELPPEPHAPDVVLGAQFGREIAIRDLDGNGERDLVVAQQGFLFGTIGSLRIYLQRDGLFEHHLALDDLRYYSRVIVDDVGADGSLEIVALGNPGSVRIWRATGGGLDLESPNAALASPCLPFVSTCRLLEAADFDGDGLIDLLEHSQPTSPGEAQLRIRRQESPRLFESQPSVSIPSGLENPLPSRSADLDGDGRLDLVTRVADGYRVQYGRGEPGSPSFVPGPVLADVDARLVGIEDFDGDGRFDLAFISFPSTIAISIHLGRPDGAFPASPDLVIPITNDNVFRGQLADVNVDGRPDLLLSDTRLNLKVYLGIEGQLLASEPTHTVADPNRFFSLQTLLVDDLDRDGLPDLIFGLEGELAVFFQGPGGFAAQPDLRPPLTDVLGLGLGDLEGDGDLDVLGHSVRTASGNGFSGLFAFPSTSPRRLGFVGATARGGDPIPFVLGDVDLDGSLDAVTSIGTGVLLHYGK